ncbi:MAG: ATP-binding cassette domain-containing protein [Bacteroidia bacterium]
MSFSITISQVGKRYYSRWLFRGVDMELKAGDRLALIGTNGSGKSTLLRIFAGQLLPTEGSIAYLNAGKKVSYDRLYEHLSWAAPSLELYDDLTLEEHVKWHFRMKKCLLSNTDKVISKLRLEADRDKKLRLFSSGMLQRVKVGLALFTQSKLILLDEPTSNMDTRNADAILAMIDEYQGDRILILASNLEREYGSYTNTLVLAD